MFCLECSKQFCIKFYPVKHLIYTKETRKEDIFCLCVKRDHLNKQKKKIELCKYTVRVDILLNTKEKFGLLT